MKISKDLRGFTLLEVLIVLVIVAVLAGLAVPAYQSAVEKSRSQEALLALGAVRESALRFYSINSTYVTAPANTFVGTNVYDYNPNLAIGGQTNMLFSYALSGQAGLPAPTFVCTATRLAPPAGVSGTISINQAGTIVRTGSYA